MRVRNESCQVADSPRFAVLVSGRTSYLYGTVYSAVRISCTPSCILRRSPGHSGGVRTGATFAKSPKQGEAASVSEPSKPWVAGSNPARRTNFDRQPPDFDSSARFLVRRKRAFAKAESAAPRALTVGARHPLRSQPSSVNMNSGAVAPETPARTLAVVTDDALVGLLFLCRVQGHQSTDRIENALGPCGANY